MCGIAGIWGHVDEDLVRTMMQRMVHRGPDSSGVFVAPNSRGVLGHRRLAIIDPAGGKQPILGDSDGCALVANGEIYNYRSLIQRSLDDRALRTQSDSEVILRLYGQPHNAVEGTRTNRTAWNSTAQREKNVLDGKKKDS